MGKPISIDRAGRLVIPKRLRDRLGLAEGVRLHIWEEDGRLVLEPVAQEARLVEDGGLLVIEGASGPIPTVGEVRDGRIDELIARSLKR